MSESVFTVTEAAGKRIQDLIQRDGKPNLHFRLSVQGGGCSGFQYDMSLGNQMTHEDHVFEVHGVKVVVDDMSLALVAGAFGRLEPVVEPLILYRQHGANAIGAPSPRLTDILRRIARGDTRTYLNWTGHQAKALLQRFGKGLGTFLPPTEALANLEDRSWLGRKRRMLAHRLFLCGWARNLVWLLVS